MDMKLLLVVCALFGVVQFGSTLAAFYEQDFRMTTLIWNCLIPVIALFVVILFNEMNEGFKRIGSEDDERQ